MLKLKNLPFATFVFVVGLISVMFSVPGVFTVNVKLLAAKWQLVWLSHAFTFHMYDPFVPVLFWNTG